MSEIEDLVAEYLPAYERWLKLRQRVQVSFHMTLPSVLAADETISVRIFEADRSAKLGVELLAVMPPYFIQGTLTDAAVEEIEPLLRGIHGVTGRSFEDAVALLATFQVFVLDTLRLDESVGIRKVWTDFENEILPGVILDEDWSDIFAPEFSPQKIRALWDTAVLPFLHWYLGRHDGKSDIVSLKSVPPVTMRTLPISDEGVGKLIEAIVEGEGIVDEQVYAQLIGDTDAQEEAAAQDVADTLQGESEQEGAAEHRLEDYPNRMVCSGEYFEIWFDGEPVGRYRVRVGSIYLALLLDSINKYRHVTRLSLYLRNPNESDAGAETPVDMGDENIVVSRFMSMIPEDAREDSTAWKQYALELKAYRDTCTAPEEREAAANTLKEFNQEYNIHFDQEGRPRKLMDRLKLAQESVRKAFDRMKEALEEVPEAKAFYDYVAPPRFKARSGGYDVKPDPDRDWYVTLPPKR